MRTYCAFCDKCGHEFEFQSYMEESHLVPSCPECHAHEVYRDYGRENVHWTPPVKTVGGYMDKFGNKSTDEQGHILGRNLMEQPSRRNPTANDLKDPKVKLTDEN